MRGMGIPGRGFRFQIPNLPDLTAPEQPETAEGSA